MREIIKRRIETLCVEEYNINSDLKRKRKTCIVSILRIVVYRMFVCDLKN